MSCVRSNVTRLMFGTANDMGGLGLTALSSLNRTVSTVCGRGSLRTLLLSSNGGTFVIKTSVARFLKLFSAPPRRLDS